MCANIKNCVKVLPTTSKKSKIISLPVFPTTARTSTFTLLYHLSYVRFTFINEPIKPIKQHTHNLDPNKCVTENVLIIIACRTKKKKIWSHFIRYIETFNSHASNNLDGWTSARTKRRNSHRRTNVFDGCDVTKLASAPSGYYETFIRKRCRRRAINVLSENEGEDSCTYITASLLCKKKMFFKNWQLLLTAVWIYFFFFEQVAKYSAGCLHWGKWLECVC